MAIRILPVNQRVIDIDSRRFASIEKAVVELITNSDDSYGRLEQAGFPASGIILFSYERHLNGALLIVADQAEGLSFERIIAVLSYGGAHSNLAQGEASGRGYFGRGLKQAVYGLGHGWIESIAGGRLSRVDLYRTEDGQYVFNDSDGDRPAQGKDYQRLGLAEGGSGTRVSIVIDNPQTSLPYFSSLVHAVSNNFYLRDILRRRQVEMINLNLAKKIRTSLRLQFEEPEAEILIGPESPGEFPFQGQNYLYTLTLKKAISTELVIKGDERTNGLLVLAGQAVFDCQFFRYENQLGTEFLYGTVVCDGLAAMLAQGHAVISDERDGLNLKEPFVAAFADAVSDRIENIIKSEQLRLSHFDHAIISGRTRERIGRVLQKMNRIAVEDLGIILPPGPGSGQPGPYDTGRPAVLRFSTPFYYRKVGLPFHVTMIVDRQQLLDQDILAFNYELPASITVEPRLAALAVADLPPDGRLIWTVTGTEIDQSARIGVSSGPYSAFCELVIAENASGFGYGHPSGKPPRIWNMDNGTDLFCGYELRNLDNDMERAVYSPAERLVLINTEAPTVRYYVNGQGHFKDGARLLLAELLLDVITGELARLAVDRSTRKGEADAYRQVKQDLIRRYGVVIHALLLGES